MVNKTYPRSYDLEVATFWNCKTVILCNIWDLAPQHILSVWFKETYKIKKEEEGEEEEKEEEPHFILL